MKNHMVLFEDGYVFACTSVRSETVRFNAAVLISIDGEPFAFAAGGHELLISAVLIRPMLTRRVAAEHLRLVSIGLSPNHRHFRSFAELDAPGFLVLAASCLRPLTATLSELHGGTLDGPRARVAFDAIVADMVARLPTPKALDERVQQAAVRLQRDPALPLDRLADEVGLSYDRMSHLFSTSMGLSMRAYALSLKIQNACRLIGSNLTLTDIAHAAGFSDSSHFSRVWLKAFGTNPSQVFSTAHLTVVPNVRRRNRSAVEPPTG